MDTDMNDTELTSIGNLCKLVEALSVHQRQLSGKIEELHAHHEQLYAHQDQLYSQIDSLFSVFSLIPIRHPLPTMRGWPVSPDFVKILVSLFLEMKPESVVETGSGISTIIGGYCLEKNTVGNLISYDHEENFAHKSSKNLKLHKLENKASVIHAPLTELVLDGELYSWYDVNCISHQDKIDLLVVDGPPGNSGSMARYPALPVFFERLSKNAVIILDDAGREAERQIVERWMSEYDVFEHEYIETEKGTVILRRTS